MQASVRRLVDMLASASTAIAAGTHGDVRLSVSDVINDLCGRIVSKHVQKSIDHQLWSPFARNRDRDVNECNH